MIRYPRDITAPDPHSQLPLFAVMRQIPALLGLVALLAVGSSTLYFHRFHDFSTDFVNPDTPGYITPAANLLAGHGFSDAQGLPDTFRTPGYPMLILPFLWAGLDLKYLILLQHVLRVLIIVGTAAFTFQLTQSRRQALVAGVFLGLDLPFLRSANTLLTEVFFTAVLGIVLWLLWAESRPPRKPGSVRCLIAGLLGGASVLIRPIAILLFLPVAAFWLLARPKPPLRSLLTFTLAFLCLPALWIARNGHQTGYFTISSISGYSMLQYRAAGVLAINDPGDFYANLDKRQHELESRACEEWKRRSGRDCSQMTVAEQSQYYTRFGREVVLRHPLAYLKLAARGFAMMMLTGSPASLVGFTGMRFEVAAKLLLLYTVPALVLGLAGLWQCWRRHRSFFWLAGLILAYFVVLSSGAETFARFRVPIVPVYAVLVAIGVDSLLHRLSSCHSLDHSAPAKAV